MSRISRLYLVDIIESCQNVRDYTNGMTFENFSTDLKTIDAVVRNLEIIGEAVKSLPPEKLSLKTEIPWKEIARFRDIIVNHYFKVDFEVVCDIVRNKIDPLESAVSDLLKAENAEE